MSGSGMTRHGSKSFEHGTAEPCGKRLRSLKVIQAVKKLFAISSSWPIVTISRCLEDNVARMYRTALIRFCWKYSYSLSVPALRFSNTESCDGRLICREGRRMRFELNLLSVVGMHSFLRSSLITFEPATSALFERRRHFFAEGAVDTGGGVPSSITVATSMFADSALLLWPASKRRSCSTFVVDPSNSASRLVPYGLSQRSSMCADGEQLFSLRGPPLKILPKLLPK